jgi:hypothetical protein
MAKAWESVTEAIFETLRHTPLLTVTVLINEITSHSNYQYNEVWLHLYHLRNMGLITDFDWCDQEVLIITDHLLESKCALDIWTTQHRDSWPRRCRHVRQDLSGGCTKCAVNAGLSLVLHKEV